MMKLFDDSYFINKTALITGGSQGIGLGIVLSFLKKGGNVIVADLHVGGCEKALEAYPDQFLYKQTDITNISDIEDLIRSALEKFGGIDYLINNARPRLKTIPDADVEASLLTGWDQGIDILLKAPMILLSHVLPVLLNSKSPAVVNITSTNAEFISQQPLVYHAAKAALIQATKYVAYMLGRKGLRANCVAPGLVDIYDRGAALTNDPINKATVGATVPLGRASTVEEVADSVLFLCSSYSSYINGQVLKVDGGISLGDHFYVGKSIFEDMYK